MLFISHSTKDKAVALDVHSWLLEMGYSQSQIFLDSDADSGIQAGSEWKESLHDGLKHCTALIVLYSNHWRSSDWCSYELGYARAIGKPIFPVLIEDTPIIGMAAEYQAVLIWKDRTDACDRLWKSLQEQHLGPNDTFLWPHPDLKGDACPFPGLPAFDERYAAVYFGREPETQDVLAFLRKMRDEGEPRLLMIHGGSGSGKSSLLKAGVLPRIGSPDWVVLPTLRPGASNEDSTIFDQLARDLVGLFPKDAKSPPEWKAFRERIQSENTDDAAKFFFEVTQDLTMAHNHKDATVLLAIDQYEEFLSPSASKMAVPFMRFLGAVFARKNGRLLAIGTIRSDYLDVYERQPHAMKAPLFHAWRLGPFPRERIPDVIYRPAERAQVKISEELLRRLTKDTPSADSLPLLAFTLEKLYRNHRIDQKLQLPADIKAGVMDWAIRSTIDDTLPPNTLTPEVNLALRRVFVEHLSQRSLRGLFERRTARWSDLPNAAYPVLERFIEHRLLVKKTLGDIDPESSIQPATQESFVEVAHEAMFRCWPELAEWLRLGKEGLIPLIIEKVTPLGLLTELELAALRWTFVHYLTRKRDDGEIEAIDANPQALPPSVMKPLKRFEDEKLLVRSGPENGQFRVADAALFRAWDKCAEWIAAGPEAALSAYIDAVVSTISFTPETQIEVKRVFRIQLCRVDEHDRFTTREYRWDSISSRAKSFLEEFVKNSLLHRYPKNGEQLVVVSHTEMFEWWRDLKKWLMKSVDVMRWRRDVRRDQATDKKWSGLRPAQLAVARNWPKTRTAELDNDEVNWIKQGIRRQWLWGAAAASVFLTISVLGVFAWWQRNDAKTQANNFKRASDEAAIAEGNANDAAGDAKKSAREANHQAANAYWQIAIVDREQGLNIKAAHNFLRAAEAFDQADDQTERRNSELAAQFASSGLVRSFVHDSAVHDVRVNRDETRVLSWGQDGAVKLWDVTKAEPLQVWKHGNNVYGAEFSRDESRVLSWGADGAVKLWDVTRAEPLQVWTHDKSVSGAIFTRDESRVLSWSTDGTVKLWDVTKVEPLRVWKHDRSVLGAVFTRDESRVLSRGADGAVKLWDVTRAEPLQVWQHGNGNLNSAVVRARFIQDESRVLSWGDGAVKLWDVTKVEPLQVWEHGNLVSLSGALLTRDECHVLSWGGGAVKLWDVTKAEPLRVWSWSTTRNWLSGAVLSRDESRVLSWGTDGAVRLWDVTKAEPLQVWKHDDTVSGAVFSRDESHVLSWGKDGAVKLWDVTKVEPLKVWKHGNLVDSAQFTRDESRTLSWSADGAMKLWDVTKTEPLQICEHTKGLNGALFIRGESHVLSWSSDGAVKLWDLTKAGPLQVWKHEHGNSVSGAIFSRDESHVLSWGTDGAVKLWNVTNEVPLQVWKHDNPVSGAIFTRDESRVLSWGADDAMKLWDATNAEPLHVWKHGKSVSPQASKRGIFGAVFTRDESRILSWGADCTVRLWDVTKADPLQIWKHDQSVFGAVFTRDESRFLSWAGDGAIRLWDVTKAEPIQVWSHGKSVSAPFTSVSGAIFTRDESRVLSWGGRNGEIKLWDVTKADPLRVWKHDSAVPFKLYGAVFTQDESRIFSWGGRNGAIKLWDMTKAEPLKVWNNDPSVAGTEFTRDESRFISWAADGTVRLWDVTKVEPLQVWKHDQLAFGAEFTRDESCVLSWGGDGSVKLWPVTQAGPLHVWKHGNWVRGAVLTRDESRILSWGGDGTVKLWHVASRGVNSTPAQRSLELKVRSATRLDSAGQVVPLKSAEWLDLCREWDRIKTEVSERTGKQSLQAE